MPLFITGLLCFTLFLYHIHKEPRRLLCGILLLVSLYLIIRGGLTLYAPNTMIGADILIIGEGDEIMLWIEILLLFISFFGGIALCVNGVRLIRKEGSSLAHILPIGFGLMGIALPLLIIFPLRLGLMAPSAFPVLLWLFPIFLNIVLYVPWMLSVFLIYSFVYALLPKSKNCDFILVLGCGLKNGETVSPLLAGRLDRAIKQYKLGGKKASFVVSGGQGHDEKVSEAFAMKTYLLQKGIPENHIILEDKSVNTLENMSFSKKLMQELNPNYNCIVVTSNYHVLRAVILARSVNLNAQGVGGHTAFYYLPAAFIREYIAIIFKYKALALAYIVAMIVFELLNV
ncbi:membrane protein [Clostridia bacterium]|nr:membrane protein [Clostridia bacterium]